MKKVFVAVLLLFITIDGFPQVGIGIGGRGFGMGMRIPINSKRQQAQSIDNHVKQMKSDLNLDSSQVVQVRGLLVERDRRKSKGNPMPREEFNKRIDEILTPEQKQRFRDLRNQKHNNRQQQPAPAAKDSTGAKKPAPDTEWDDVYK